MKASKLVGLNICWVAILNRFPQGFQSLFLVPFSSSNFPASDDVMELGVFFNPLHSYLQTLCMAFSSLLMGMYRRVRRGYCNNVFSQNAHG